MQNSFDMSTIIFALLAAFVVWKLRSVLGARTGTEKPPRNPFAGDAPATRPPEADGRPLPPPGPPAPQAAPPASAAAEAFSAYAEPGSRTAAGLAAIAAADPSFDVKGFLGGAKVAYEMIVTAFADGDRQMLRNLLDKSVYDSFAAALSEREKLGRKVETSFVALDDGKIEDAELNGRLAEIAVRFTAQIVTATRDGAGAVVEGNADQVVEITDTWRFAREAGSNDPNWRLVSTHGS